jgi:hypothetical protein
VLGLFAFVTLVTWFILQFRPARQPIWKHRWEKQWRPFGLAVRAMWVMAWQGFVVDPTRRLWRWGSARQESRRTLDAALDRLLGRDQ